VKRPLLRVALFYVGGILAADLVFVSPWLLLILALGSALAAIAWTRARPLLLCALSFLAGATELTLHAVVLSPHDLRRILGSEPQIVTVRGQLRETPIPRVYQQGETPSWRTLCRIELTDLRLNQQPWRPATGRLAVTTPGMLTNLFGGQTVEITGVAALPRVATAEGTFDYRAFLRQQGIYYQLQAESEEDWHILRSPAAAPLADRFRDWARKALARGLPQEDESLRLEWALTLGWKPALTEEVSEPFIQAATYHIFAVDGLRMAILFGIFFGLFRAVGMPRSWCGVLLLPLIWFYVALTGWPASAIRATVMLSVVIVGWVFKRPSELINSLFCAALIILVWEPQQLFQAGFQLSFLVVLCLILMLKPCFDLFHRLTAPDPLLPKALHRRWPPFIQVPARYVGDVWMTSFAAWVGSIPLVAYYFHIVTPVSTPANLVAVPLCALVLISNFASLLLVGWFPGAAELFNHAGWFVMECIRVTSHWFAGWPKAYFYVPAPGTFTTAVYYAVLLGLVTGWLLKPAFRRCKLAGLALTLLVWGWTCGQETLVTRLTILPVSGGTAVYCDGPGRGNDFLADTGSTNSVQFVTKPFLRAQGVNSLPTLVLTHGDLRHVGGAETLADLFPTRQICVSLVRFRSTAYRRTLAHFNQREGLVRTISRHSLVGCWTVLHPDASDRFPRADDDALVLRGTFGRTRVLLLSDLGRAGQEALLERAPQLRAEIVVTGLPSTGEAIADALLERIQPRVIVVTDSEFPASERARQPFRDRLARRGIPVLYTRATGAVTIEFRGNHWEIRTMNGTKLDSEKFLFSTSMRRDRLNQIRLLTWLL
jgi:competence protein ComEC